MLNPEIAKNILSSFKIKDRPSLLDAVRLGSESNKELETWSLFCSLLAWGGLLPKRKILIEFYEKLPNTFLDFLNDPSQKQLRRIYRNEGGSKQLHYLCLSIQDLLDEHRSIGSFLKETDNLTLAIFRLAYELRKNLETYMIKRKFNLPKVELLPPKTKNEKRKTNALKRYCMYFRWMVRDSEPDFGLWKFFKKRDLYHPLDRHVARILKRWGVLDNNLANWENVINVTEYFKIIEPSDPTKYDYHLVTFGQNYCRKNDPLCEICSIRKVFRCIL